MKKILFISYDCVGAPVDSVQVPSTPPHDFSSAILNNYALDQNRFCCVKIPNYSKIMDPLNLSGMLRTPAENRTNLDAEYHDEIWRLPEKFPIKKKCMSLKMMERKLWQARLHGLKFHFICRQCTAECGIL